MPDKTHEGQSESAEILLEFRDVSRHYESANKTVHALSDVSLQVRRGEVVAVVGRSGSGKTTLLNLSAGIDIPNNGIVTILGRNLADATDAERTLWRRHDLGIVFQFFNLLPALTAMENVIFPASVAGRSRKESAARAAELLDMFGVAGTANRFPDQLSGGEQQRVALARAIINRPSLILADEPTGNLDHDNATFVMRTLSDLAKRERCGVLLVTHSREALEFVDRAITLRDGRIADGA